MAVIFPNITEIEYVAHDLANKFMLWNEPIPDFSTRFGNVLESCIATPQQMFEGKSLYPGLYKKAAMLFYLLVKNHPFQNGNKRIAVMTLLYFLHKNGKWLQMTNDGVYLIAKYVAASRPDDKERVLSMLHDFVKNNAVRASV